MNIDKNYNLEHFNQYNNFFTIMVKKVKLYYKKVIDENSKPIYVHIGEEKTKYFPIYGHFYNDENYFIYQKVYGKQILNKYRNNKYYIINVSELAKPLHGNFYVFNSLEECLKTIDNIK